MIQVERLSFAYGKTQVLHDINLTVKRGEILSIVGPNGCGKSTLLKLMRGQLPPGQGRIIWQGRDITTLNRRALARMAAVVPQSTPVHFPFPVRELVMMGRYARQAGWWGASATDHQAVERALAVTDTLHLAERPVTQLSGGEHQRVLLARALAQETPLLLLDEATSHLDLDHRLEMADLLVRLNREQGTTVVQISHDLDLAAEISQRVLLMNRCGEVMALGQPHEVFTSDHIRQVFRVEVQIETNPYSGAPRLYSTRSISNWQAPPRIHVICGGGSGGELLRRLHVAGCQLSVGPLNRGDTDLELALALNLEATQEQPFCSISVEALDESSILCRAADVLIIAPTFWGPGNLTCLDLARDALDRQQPVLLIDPHPDRDFSGGPAWSTLQTIIARGGVTVTDVEAVLERLKRPIPTVNCQSSR
jgi:cobalamin transport system ATP-binding protein